MKDTFYFSHDYNPTSDPKIQALIGEHGAVGYGLYWRIVEMLHEEETHKLPCKKYIYLALAKQMSTSVEQVSTSVQQNPTKESKGKKRKEKEDKDNKEDLPTNLFGDESKNEFIKK